MSKYISRFYNSHYMDSFADSFYLYNLKDDKKGREILFRNLIIDKEISETLMTRNWVAFKKTCEELVSIGNFSSIIRFMFGVFYYSGIYDLKRIQEELTMVEVIEGKNLAEICSDFYVYIRKKENEILARYTPEDLDVYLGDSDKYFAKSTYPTGTITKELPGFIVKYILNYEIDINNLSKDDIDKIADKAIALRNERILEEEKEIRSINEEKEIFDKKCGMQTVRLVNKKITDFDKKILIPGLMLEIFKGAELTGQNELAYYIQYNYLWPIFAKVPWKQVDRLDIQHMVVLIKSYMYYKYSLVTKDNPIFYLSDKSASFDTNIFFKELIKNEKGSLMATGIELGGKYPNLSLKMAETLTKGGKVIKNSLPDYLYSFTLSFTSYLLYCSGHTKEAIDFQVRYYDEISFYDKRMYYVQFTLIRSILSSERIEDAAILYGYYNYEMDRQERDRRLHIETIEEITEYLLDVKEYLELRNEHTLDTKKPWVDVIFGDGRMMQDVEYTKSMIDKDEIPGESLFRRLMLYVEALSYESGIRLKMLNLGNEDGHDKLENALSKEFINLGQGFIYKQDENLSFYQSIKLINIRKRINTLLQNHIYKLMDETIKESMELIKDFRTEYILNYNANSRTSNMNDEDITAEAKSLLEILDEVINNLTKRLVIQYIGREEIEKSLASSQKQFINKYNLQVENYNLINRLPVSIQNDCYNYLVTSEIVFKVLSNREDKGKLDFSSALIPLTKAIEMILNNIYARMDVREYGNIDYKTKNNYLKENGAKRDSIAFGPCILLLGDGFININEREGKVDLKWGKMYLEKESRFRFWGGDSIIDFSKLKQFKGLEIIFEKSFGNTRTLRASFSEDTEYNRMLFIKGLDYIRNNYRNVVAHKDGVSLQTFAEARNILLQTEELLWVFIYLINE